MDPLNTRSRTKQKTILLRKTIITSKTNSPNCSVLSFSKCDFQEDLVSGMYTAHDIIVDLNNKLAQSHYELTESENNFAELFSQFKNVTKLNELSYMSYNLTNPKTLYRGTYTQITKLFTDRHFNSNPRRN